MIIDIFLIIIALISLILGSIHDIKTHEVPDWLNFSLLSTGLALRLIYSITFNQFTYFTYAILSLIAMILLGTLLYYTKQWGGGDAKLLMALGTIFATKPFFIKPQPIPFLITLIINILIVGAIYGIIYSIVLVLKNRKKFIQEFKTVSNRENIKFIQKLILILSTIILILIITSKNTETRFILGILTILIILYTYFWIAIKSLEKCCMEKTISISKAVEGDWLAQDIIKNKKLILSKNNPGLEKKDIEKLKRLRIDYIKIKQGIAFVPSFLLGTIVTLLGFNILNFI